MTTDRDIERRPGRIPVTLGWGVALAFLVALISGVSVFVNAYGVKQVPDAGVYTTLKNGVAALILLIAAFVAVRPAEIRALDARAWAGMTVIGVIGGSVPFVLFFSGLALASAPTAAFIQKTLFIWVAFLAVPLLGERLGVFPIAAISALLAGQVLAAPPVGVAWGAGETMIAAATLLWAVEVVIARHLLLDAVPSPVLGAARMGIGLVVLVGYLAVSGRIQIVAGLTATQWAWAMGTGALLAAYVGTWLAALRRAPATVVASVLVIGAPITAGIQAFANGSLPGPSVVGGLSIMTLAVCVLAAWAVRSARGTGRVPA